MNWFRIDLGGKTGYLFRLYYNREEEWMYSWNKPGKEHFPVANCFLTGGEKSEVVQPVAAHCTPEPLVLQYQCNSRCNWGYLLYTWSPASAWILQGQVWKSKQSYDWDPFPSILQVSKKSTNLHHHPQGATLVLICCLQLAPQLSVLPLQGKTKDAPGTHRGLWVLNSYSVIVPLLSRDSGVLTSQFHRSYMQHWICALTKVPFHWETCPGKHW